MSDEYKIIFPTPEHMDLLEGMMELLKVDPAVWSEIEEYIQKFAGLVGYRTQYALYEIIRKIDQTLGWEEYVMFVRLSQEIRTAIAAVAIYAVKHFDMGELDFHLSKAALEQHVKDSGIAEHAEISVIFDDATGRNMILDWMLRVEKEYFRRLHEENPQYTWKVFDQELRENKEMDRRFYRACRYGLLQIDFMASWYNEDIPETAFLRSPDEQSDL